MRRTLCILLSVAFLLSLPPSVFAGEDCIVVPKPVWQGDRQAGALDLRFYPASPHVAYAGMKAYVSCLRQEEMTVTVSFGLWRVENPLGAFILADPSAGKITAPDWAAFQSPLPPYEGMVGVKDAPCAWTRYTGLVFDDPPKERIFDFARYGIALYADAEDVYLPLALLSTMFTDVAINYLAWNGDKLYRSEVDLDTLTELPEDYYATPRMRALMTGEARRAEDEIRESFGELCFILEHFFGHPGTSLLDAPIREKGLEEALKGMPEGEGEQILSQLKSPDMVEYLIGLSRLFGRGLDDGHTVFSGISNILALRPAYPAAMMRILFGAGGALTDTSGTWRTLLLADVMRAREAAWGEEVYRECGNTAVLRIDEFNPDDEGWEAYYAGAGEIPMDCLGITVTGLRRAKDNPAIHNILFDLSCNTGGSGDILMAMLSLVTGEKEFKGYNVLTEQRQRAFVQVDRNLDGVFDEKDDAVRYDFKYGVLTTRMSFSCGNLFPILMREHGAVVLGEPSGGGSCSVQAAVLSSGAVFLMSSCLWALQDADGQSVESGCAVDLPIERIEPLRPTHEDPRFASGDYAPYFDDAELDRMMNEWFALEAELPAA